MINEQDLQEAIAECMGERNPNANTCIKLAAFYTIRNELFGNSEQPNARMLPEPSYSFAAPPEPAETTITYDSGTDFSRIINGRNPDNIWPIMDELMDTIHTIMPRLYDGVMRKLQE